LVSISGSANTTPDAIVSWLKSALSDALSEVLEAAAGEEKEDPQPYAGWTDPEHGWNAHRAQVLEFRDAIRSKIEEV